MHFTLVSALFFNRGLQHMLYDSYNLNNTKERVSTKKKNKKKDEKNVINAKTVHFALVSARFFYRRLLHVLYDSYSLNITKERVSKKKKKRKKMKKMYLMPKQCISQLFRPIFSIAGSYTCCIIVIA